jgi:hypothetical protein
MMGASPGGKNLAFTGMPVQSRASAIKSLKSLDYRKSIVLARVTPSIQRKGLLYEPAAPRTNVELSAVRTYETELGF